MAPDWYAKALEATSEANRKPGGHLWAEPIVLQTVCRLCGHLALLERVASGDVPACTWGNRKELLNEH